MSKSSGFRHTRFGWGLGTFGFILAAIFLVRMYAVHEHRLIEERIRDQVERAGLLIQRSVQAHLREVETLGPTLSRPKISGVKALRYYQVEAASPVLIHQWNDESVSHIRFGLEMDLARDPGTRIVQLNDKLLGLSWQPKNQTKALLVLDKVGAFPLTSDDLQISLALINSAEQILSHSGPYLDFETFRRDYQYRYDGKGEVEIASLETEVLGYYSVPGIKGLVVVGRYKR